MLSFALCVGEKKTKREEKKLGIIQRREKERDKDICIYTSHLPL
jgi:hypothetical protein